MLVVREENASTPVKFTYTPLHGVGQKFAEAAFEVFNFPPLISVPEQVRKIHLLPIIIFDNGENGTNLTCKGYQFVDIIQVISFKCIC